MDGRSDKQVGGSRGMSLRARLVLLVLASLVPLIAFTIARRYFDYREAVERTGERSLMLAHSMALAVDEELHVRVAALTAIARSPALQTGDAARFRRRAEVTVEEEFPGGNLMILKA